MESLVIKFQFYKDSFNLQTVREIFPLEARHWDIHGADIERGKSLFLMSALISIPIQELFLSLNGSEEYKKQFESYRTAYALYCLMAEGTLTTNVDFQRAIADFIFEQYPFAIKYSEVGLWYIPFLMKEHDPFHIFLRASCWAESDFDFKEAEEDWSKTLIKRRYGNIFSGQKFKSLTSPKASFGRFRRRNKHFILRINHELLIPEKCKFSPETAESLGLLIRDEGKMRLIDFLDALSRSRIPYATNTKSHPLRIVI